MARWLLYAIGLGACAAQPVDAQRATVSTFDTTLVQAPAAESAMTEDRAPDFILHELVTRPGAGKRSSASLVARALPSAPIQPVSADSGCGQSLLPPRLLPSGVAQARRAFWPVVAAAECQYGLPAGLLDSVVLAESRYDPASVSPVGAAGLAQLMPGTASDLGLTDRFDPAGNVFAGARYLRGLLTSFSGDVRLALAAYNAGPAAIKRTRGIPVNGETPGYVRRVLDYWAAPGVNGYGPALTARQTAELLGFTPAATN